MSGWSLPRLLAGLHDDIESRLAVARKSFAHSVTKGDASETVWLDLMKSYLPRRYQVETAHVVDSNGAFSQQIDILIFDRQYSPFIFHFEGQIIVPAESVYAAFEAKQTINAAQVAYAQEKVASVRVLHRTNLPIPHAGGTYAPRPLTPILGGLLTFESDWTPPLGTPLQEALLRGDPAGSLDIGCIAAHGGYALDPSGAFVLSRQGKPAAAFLLELIARLQAVATVPMIDIRAYARWLAE